MCTDIRGIYCFSQSTPSLDTEQGENYRFRNDLERRVNINFTKGGKYLLVSYINFRPLLVLSDIPWGLTAKPQKTCLMPLKIQNFKILIIKDIIAPKFFYLLWFGLEKLP
jgi:hypothetical protein